MAAIIIPGQSGTYRHLQGRVTGLLAESGQTEQARVQKIGGGRLSSAEVGWDDYEARLSPDRFALVRVLFDRMEKVIEDRAIGWTPRLLAGYFCFQRQGGYTCAGADIRQEVPVELLY